MILAGRCRQLLKSAWQKVWSNAATSLEWLARFSGHERLVQMDVLFKRSRKSDLLAAARRHERNTRWCVCMEAPVVCFPVAACRREGFWMEKLRRQPGLACYLPQRLVCIERGSAVKTKSCIMQLRPLFSLRLFAEHGLVQSVTVYCRYRGV